MQKKTSLLFGTTLILMAILALAGNLLVRLSGNAFPVGFRSWPILVIAAGLLFCLPPFVFSKVHGLGGLFIPGMPVLVTGLILFITSVTSNWSLWADLWPLEVLAVSLGFFMAAIFLRVIWLGIPATIVGVNGLILLFCALTHRWDAWAVLWTLEPFSVGLPLFVIGLVRKIDGVKLAGMILGVLSGIAFAAMSSLLPTNNLLLALSGPALILGVGIYLVVAAFFKRPVKQIDPPSENAPETPATDQ
jgi:hypothetical protein